MKTVIQLTVNGEPVEAAVEPNRTLVQFLREDLGLTGTKHGCGLGDCGACTVILDGNPVNSCLVLAVQAAGCEVLTIEGLAKSGELHPIQKSFVDHGAVQCGFCSPGMILSPRHFWIRIPTRQNWKSVQPSPATFVDAPDIRRSLRP